MFDVFGSVKGLLKLDQVCIDNNIFRLHYKATVIVLIAFSLLVTSRQYIGDPIDCIVDEIPLNVMDTYCWIYSTFTIPNRLTGVIGRDVVQPGVGSHVEGEDEVKYHKYYQWVCFVLFFQGKITENSAFWWGLNWRHPPKKNNENSGVMIETSKILIPMPWEIYFFYGNREKKRKKKFLNMCDYYYYLFIVAPQPFAFMCRVICGRHGKVDASKCSSWISTALSWMTKQKRNARKFFWIISPKI